MTGSMYAFKAQYLKTHCAAICFDFAYFVGQGNKLAQNIYS